MSRGPDDFGRPPVGHSGAVTAVAIINFIFGGLQTLAGVAVMIAGPAALAWLTGAVREGSANIQTQGLSPAEAEKVKQAAQAMAQAGGGFFAFVAGLIGVCFLIFGVPILLAGFGVISRRQWGRILTIVMGIFCLVWGVVNLLTGNIISLALNLAYGIFVLVVLFNSKFAAEFRSSP